MTDLIVTRYMSYGEYPVFGIYDNTIERLVLVTPKEDNIDPQGIYHLRGPGVLSNVSSQDLKDAARGYTTYANQSNFLELLIVTNFSRVQVEEAIQELRRKEERYKGLR